MLQNSLMLAEQRMYENIKYYTDVDGPDQTGCALKGLALLTGATASLVYVLGGEEIGIAIGLFLIPTTIALRQALKQEQEHSQACDNLLKNARNHAVVDLPTLKGLNIIESDFYQKLRDELYKKD